MLNITELVGFGVVGSLPSISYINNYVDISNATSYSFAGVSFGSEADRSLVIIGVAGRQGSNTEVVSATIGGVSATLVTKSPRDNSFTAIFVANASGTSGTVDVVLDAAGASGCTIGVWAAYNLISTTAFSSNSAGVSTGLTVSTSVNVPSNGVVVAVGSVNSGSARTVTWTGVTERYDDIFEGSRGYTGGDYTAVSAETGRSISFTASDSINNLSLSTASWS